MDANGHFVSTERATCFRITLNQSKISNMALVPIRLGVNRLTILGEFTERSSNITKKNKMIIEKWNSTSYFTKKWKMKEIAISRWLDMVLYVCILYNVQYKTPMALPMWKSCIPLEAVCM